jgi:hypothetical protein
MYKQSNVALRLQNLKASKATGMDNIPAKVLLRNSFKSLKSSFKKFF